MFHAAATHRVFAFRVFPTSDSRDHFWPFTLLTSQDNDEDDEAPTDGFRPASRDAFCSRVFTRANPRAGPRCEPTRHRVASFRAPCCLRSCAARVVLRIAVDHFDVTELSVERSANRPFPRCAQEGSKQPQRALDYVACSFARAEAGRQTTPRSCGLQGLTPSACPFEPGVTGTRRYSHGVSLLQG